MNKKYISYYLEAFESLPKRAKELLFEEEAINEDVMMRIADNCEWIKSPIEQILLVAISICNVKYKRNFQFDVQHEIDIDDKKYIADFYVEYDEWVNVFLRKDFKLIIECDGFEYHHLTKKQVNYDYERENNLKLNGYDVIRFSGTQIYNEPIECAMKITEYIKKKGLNKNE